MEHGHLQPAALFGRRRHDFAGGILDNRIIFGRQWIGEVQWRAVVIFVAVGLSYTAFSEYLNVYMRRSWEYSLWMPTFIGFGMVPLVQWIVVPAMRMSAMKRFQIIGSKNTQGGKEG